MARVRVMVTVRVRVRFRGFMSNKSVTECHGASHYIYTISRWCAPFSTPPCIASGRWIQTTQEE